MTFIKIILITAFLCLFIFSIRAGNFKNFLLSGVISVLMFFGLNFLKVLPLFKIGINLFNLSIVFFLGAPGMISLLFFNILSVL